MNFKSQITSRRIIVAFLFAILLAQVPGGAFNLEPAHAATAILNKNVFGPNETVEVALGTIFKDACDLSPGGFFNIFPTATFYVVLGTVVNGQALVDASGAPNFHVSTFGGGGVFDLVVATTLPAPNGLDNGVYSLVVDECSTGVFNAGFDLQLSNAITVILPSTLPPVDPLLVQMKTDAATAATRANTAVGAWDLILALEKLNNAAFGDLADKFIGELTNAVQKSLGLGDPRDLARALLLSEKLAQTALAADPPDPNFMVVTTLDPIEFTVPLTSSPIDKAMADYANAVVTENALSKALLQSLERYQGATNADNGE